MKPTGPRDPLTGLPLTTIGRVEYQIPPETVREINEGAIKLLRETVDFLEGRSQKTGDELVDEIRAHLLLQ